MIGQATGAQEAAALAEQRDPDVVILDIRMPGGGIRALQAIKRNTASRVIVLTAYSYPQYRERCMQLGADRFLVKDTGFDQLPQVLLSMQKEQKEVVYEKR